MSPSSGGSYEMREVVALIAGEDVERRIREALRSVVHVTSHEKWSDFEEAAGRPDCAIVPVLRIETETADRLREIERMLPGTPVVLVIAEGLEQRLRAVDAVVGEVVLLSHVSRGLPAVVARAIERTYLRRVARKAEGSKTVPPIMAAAIAAACRSRSPVQSLDDLVVLVGWSRSALARVWQTTAPPSITPKVFLDWLLLLRALAWKTRRRSWESIAEDLRVDKGTLAHVARRLMHRHLTDLGAASLGVVRQQFARVVLIPLGIGAP